MFKGYQNLTDEQKLAAAHMAAKAGLSFWDVTHIWLLDGDRPVVVLRFHSGVDVIVQKIF